MRWLVCGSGFGRHYIDACKQHGSFELVGLLARGSPRSKALAREYEVPLFESVAELPDAIDAACVAVGEQFAEPIIQALLPRGIDVLAEHPVSVGLLDRTLRSTARNGRCFHVNFHIADFAVTAAFVTHALAIGERESPLFVSAFTSPRCVHSLVDVLGRALGSLRPWTEFRSMPSPGRDDDEQSSLLGLSAALGVVAGVPACVQLTSYVSSVDDLSDAFLNHQITIGFPSGNLVLADTLGPVLWCTKGGSTVVAADPRATCPPPLQNRKVATSDHAGELRREALVVALERLRAHAAGGAEPEHQTARYLRDVCEMSRRLELALRSPSQARLRGSG